jgi:regulator of ribonuclease activity A
MKDFTTPDLFDEFRESVDVPESGLYQYGGIKKFSGQAVTVTCPEDNSLAWDILKQPGDGKILVIDGFGSKKYAFIGDIMAANALDNRWAGVVVNGCCRDVEILETMALGVMALGNTPRSTIKRGFGDKGQKVTLLSATINSGDWLYADENGLVISSQPLI